MPKQKVHQPHDKITKKILGNLDAARDILSQYLPKEILDITDLSKLSIFDECQRSD